jgi:hypothetical protein
MKQTIIVLLILISIGSPGQTSIKADQKTDSIQRAAENNKIVQEVLKTPVKDLQEWLYKNWTAERYDEFIQFYNLFIQEKFNEKKKPVLKN